MSYVEGCHHVLPPDVRNHHLEGKPFGIGVFFEDVGESTFGHLMRVVKSSSSFEIVMPCFDV